MPDVRPATLDDAALVARIAASGFYDDPVMRWVFPDDAVRLDRLRFLFSGLVDDLLPDRGVVHLGEGAAAALWRDPTFEHGRTAADRAGEATADQLMPFTPDELDRLIVLGGTMAASHPHEPHWYLNVVSTVPEHQGRGLGSAVLQPVLDRCDADGARAYLESTNPRNHTLYHRHGFVDAGELQLEGGPAMMAMWRDPR
ncbi:MAG: GNAT family N-acetyltransferase [Acidimicrobiales bacterium]